MNDISRIKADIERARKWARQHFNAYVDEDTTPSHLFAKPTMKVTFPDVDRMCVCPVAMGEPFQGGEADFRLCWKGKALFWKGNFLLRKELLGEGDVIKLRIP